MPYGAILGQKADTYTQEETLSNATKTLYGLQIIAPIINTVIESEGEA